MSDETKFSRLVDPEEQLLRQVHPAFVQAGRAGSRAFNPMASHEYKLSMDRGSKTTAATAFARHTKSHASAGVWAVTVGECDQANIASYDDPLDENQAHAFVDFRPLESNSKRKKAATLLARHANDRGPLFHATPPSESEEA